MSGFCTRRTARRALDVLDLLEILKNSKILQGGEGVAGRPAEAPKSRPGRLGRAAQQAKGMVRSCITIEYNSLQSFRTVYERLGARKIEIPEIMEIPSDSERNLQLSRKMEKGGG